MSEFMHSERAEVHALLDQLPVGDVLKVKRFCEALIAGRVQADCGVSHRGLNQASIRALKPQILDIARRYHATDIRIFGSVARDEADSFSDVDLLVRFDKDVSLFELVGLQEDLGDLLGCPVHVTTECSLRPEIRASVLSEAIPL